MNRNLRYGRSAWMTGLEASRGVQIEPMEAWDLNCRCNDSQADGDKAGSDQQNSKADTLGFNNEGILK